MSLTAGTPLLSPEEIAVRAGEQVSFLRLPEAGVFAERALRLRQLAAGHAMRDYLLFLAELAEVQHELLKQPVQLALPTAEQIEAAANAGLPLLTPALGLQDGRWREGLRTLMELLAARLAVGPARDTAHQLVQASDEHLTRQAERLLEGLMLGLDLGAAPLVAAALQVHWVRLVQQLQARHEREARPGSLAPFGRTDDPTTCPCCGSRPSASISRIGAEGSGIRYLACSLCASQWHYVRIKCSHCQGSKGISYQSLAALSGESTGAKPVVQAECCDSCGHYLKIVHMEHDQNVEPQADDLASLTLDLLLAESGVQRHGHNLMLLFGDPEVEPDPNLSPPGSP